MTPMRRDIIIAAIFVLAAAIGTATTAMAQEQQPGITVTNVNMTSTAEGPRLEMSVAISPGAVTNLQGIAVVPTLADAAGNRAVFPPVLVNGKNRGLIYERHEKLGFPEMEENPPYLTMNIDPDHPGGNVAYSAPIAGESWMANASLNLAFVLVSPAGERHSYSTSVTGTSVVTIPEGGLATTPPRVIDTTPPVAYTPPPVVQTPPVVIQTPPVQVPPPVVQTPPVEQTPPPVAYTPPPVVQTPPVVVQTPPVVQVQPPVVQQPQPMPVGPVQTVSGIANLDFTAASSALVPSMGRNVQELAAIDGLIGQIVALPSTGIVAITITGYSSPEGRYDGNASLAWDRALALSHYLQQRHGIPAGTIKIRAVGEDWRGLRDAVMERQDTWPSGVLEIIDSTDAPDAKESRLRRMSGGEVWRRMDGEIFPSLRKVAYSIDYQSVQ